MIRISKSNIPPQILIETGVKTRDQLIKLFEEDPDKYSSRIGKKIKDIKKMIFNRNIYAHTSVKQQLINDQYEKCCFCEGKFKDNSFGDVEHFRPKTAYKKMGDKKFTYPGYFWLAYDWNNLLFSCEKCNRKYKGNEFPLKDEKTRVTSYKNLHLLNLEDTLFINPILEDPNEFITFREEVPVAVKSNLKGVTSIKAYGLERLNETRLENLKALNRALIFADFDETDIIDMNKKANELNMDVNDLIEIIKESKVLFNSAAKDHAVFANCVRCKFPHLPKN